MRHKLLVALALCAAVLLAACTTPAKPATTSETSSQTAPAKATFPVTITDDLGRKVTIDRQPERIVSLAPANTEIVTAIGLESKLVGVTTYDDYPVSVKSLPKMGDFTTPNLEAIAAAKPDLVLLTGGVQMDVVKKLEALGAKVVVIDPKSLGGVMDAVRTVGKLNGAMEGADAAVTKMVEEYDAVQAKVKGTKQVTCFVEIAQNPLYTAGTDTLLNDMIEKAGGRNVVTEPGFVGYSLEQLLKANPDVYFATKGSMSDPAELTKRPGYDKLAAVKAGRVVVLDDNLVSRPGPRVMQGLRQIAEGLHPEAFK